MEKVKQIWKTTDCVTFDVDSTIIQELAIHELAKFCGKENSVLDLATKAMQKMIPFQQALKDSIEIISPSLNQIQEFNSTHALNLSPRIRDLVNLLHKKNIPVYLISGCFQCMILPIAKELNIPEDHVFANRLMFYFNGTFAGYKEDAPTTESTGKAVICGRLKKEFGFKRLVHIGDGYTDLETCPPADAFIGYGGNVERDVIKKEAKWFVTDFGILFDELK